MEPLFGWFGNFLFVGSGFLKIASPPLLCIFLPQQIFLAELSLLPQGQAILLFPLWLFRFRKVRNWNAMSFLQVPLNKFNKNLQQKIFSPFSWFASRLFFWGVVDIELWNLVLGRSLRMFSEFPWGRQGFLDYFFPNSPFDPLKISLDCSTLWTYLYESVIA